jgi:shikimate kinase
LESNSIARLGRVAPCVVSCGGGIVLRDLNIRKLRAIGVIVQLTAAPSVIYKRIKGSNKRPLLQGNKKEQYIEELMKARSPYYEDAADIIIPTDGKSADEIAENILKKVEIKGNIVYTINAC